MLVPEINGSLSGALQAYNYGNLRTKINIDIILFANRLFLVSMKPAKLQFGNDGKMLKLLNCFSALTADYVAFLNNILGNKKDL